MHRIRRPGLLLLLMLLSPLALADDIIIGALAYRGPEEAIERWSATADYLSHHIPEHRFQIQPLELESLYLAVARGEVHFVLTNPGHYVVLESGYGVTRIATRQARYSGHITTRFGSAIVVRSDRTDLNSLADMRGKSLMAVSPNAFGGFQLGWRELVAAGVDPYVDISVLHFAGFPHDAIIEAVQNGSVDAGIVRSGVLERMAAEGKADKTRLKVLNQRQVAGYMPALSTRLYPEWPFAKVNHTPEALAKQVAQALLAMSADDPAALAARAAGWTIPLDYTPVHDLMRELRIGPYAIGTLDWRDVLREYAAVLALAAILFFVLVVSTVLVSRSNRRLDQSRAQLARHRDTLEEEVGRRTRELRQVNEALEQDISARRRAEASLQRSGEALQRLYEISVDPALSHEQKLKRLLHLGREYFDMEAALLHQVGDQGLSLCASDGDTSHAEEVAGCLPSVEQVDGPIEVVPPPGASCNRSLLGFPVLVGGERRCMLSFVGKLRERSPLEAVDKELLRLMAQWIGAEMARQRAEDERDRHAAHLAKVGRLTTMGEMASGLAHEINQPLTVAANYTSGSLRRLRVSDPDLEAVEAGMEKAMAGVQRATEIIRHLRDFVTTGVPEKARFDLNTSIRRVIDLVANEARRAQVQLDTRGLKEGAIWLLGDSIQIEQVVMNLVRNAVEASPAGSAVRIASNVMGGQVQVRVQDHGQGFDAETQAQLFDPFFSTKADGMGLGLAISRSIIEAHGGLLWAEHNNEGACFIFQLPSREKAEETHGDA